MKLDLDLSYIGYNRFGLPIPIADVIAIYTKDPENMRLAISKLNILGRFHYSISEESSSTDLCQMTIKADELNEALKIFNADNYRLHPANIPQNIMNINTTANPTNDDYNENVIIKNANDTDVLYSIIKTLESAPIRGNKELFLSNILCSGKYSLFNIACLPYIRKIVGSELYNEYLEYIISLAEEGKIALYKMEQRLDSKSSFTMCYVSPGTIAKRNLNKTIIIEPKHENGA